MRGLRIILRWLRASFMALAALCAAPAAAWAADCGVSPETLQTPLSGIPDGALMHVDPFGVRNALAKDGIQFDLLYVGEVFGNTGGFKQGAAYDGAAYMSMNADMHRMGLWSGLCFHTDAYQIHGQSITADNIGSISPVSSYEATQSTRLFELWFEQHLFDDKIGVRVGQLAADNEFIITNAAQFLLNGTFGWPNIAAADMPAGGPAYPLATPGVRVSYNPTDKLGLLIGVYNGDPAGPNCQGDPQLCDASGLEFRLSDPPLLIAEGAYSYNKDGLAGTVKLGGWNHFGDFTDQRFDRGGNFIAVTGNAALVRDGDYGIYGIVDQLIWRLPASGDQAKGVALFARFAGAPTDRNLIDFYADGGVTFSGMIPNRPDDALAIAFAYTGISDDAGAFDVDSGLPISRNYESLLEICYTYQIKQGWALQPDFQYIWQPGGGVPDQSGKKAVENAAVFGARTTLAF